MKGFSGYLPAEQVLQLWDLMLAFDTVQILSIFAMGVLSIRKDNLMKAQQPQTVDVCIFFLTLQTCINNARPHSSVLVVFTVVK